MGIAVGFKRSGSGEGRSVTGDNMKIMMMMIIIIIIISPINDIVGLYVNK